MTAIPKRKLSETEYLAIENAAEFKSEFCNGVMYPLHHDGLRAMAGARPGHNIAKENLIVQIGMQLLGGPCRSFSSDQRVRLTASGMYAYPDIVIICGAAQYSEADENSLVNPRAIIEVLSPSTEAYDREFKFAQYQLQPSIQEYVLVSQDVMRIERYVRQPDNSWLMTVFTDPDRPFALASVSATVPMADIYRDVQLPDPFDV